ncbi:Aspartic peptidase [Gossypium australe]|uniref:Aspartic peptidase n=1 Tax=Gossypium australe TaxID=47621 RepID=A0A5B6VUT9_9ROSI|nr:Aspartic peptidase [Gossypium australe]
MTKKFLLKYFPPAKTTKCLHHGLPFWLQVQTIYNGLNLLTRQLIDVATGGTLNNKTPEVAYEFIEEMALNNY